MQQCGSRFSGASKPRYVLNLKSNHEKEILTSKYLTINLQGRNVEKILVINQTAVKTSTSHMWIFEKLAFSLDLKHIYVILE